ncbi:PTS fructose transporter subunit IIABC [[Bacillus] enclensis]|uniref:PTS system IIA component, Fru family /PTS system IIB component, Fru family /PTS system IIC component, Fru family n=1 Tax=[Bacillus] enclensis TaxID=1402860 RepID=A0A0V8HCS9_9BACI|nr:fructose-specific PTS transporter subunit EIIC [[Bacillus] enclensis]KSU60309.1 PTS fructose transporter subunit IIABC [[Bacillus] enclensis]SCC22968.1 PTS system IIA component, Fru family /PTS system IIB component, Fru family /PTS system IIC component, Fru family [[Bacillus] enclensis]
MELRKMTDEQLIMFDVDSTSKHEILEKLAGALHEKDILTSKEDFLKAVLEREQISPTGLEAGLAIPHGKSPSVKKAAFAVARLKNGIDTWESIDPNNKVQLVFLLAIPDAEAGSTHLSVLSELSTRLMDKAYIDNLMNAATPAEFLAALDRRETAVEEPQEYTKTVLAITACAAGIAHTYMSAEALEKAGREMGIRVITEKQGANGIEDAHKGAILKEADAVVFATDIAPKNKERFAGKPYVQTRVAEPLKNAKDILNRALTNPDGTVAGDENEEDMTASSGNKQGLLAEMTQAVMTGISYMIPVLVAAGLMMGIAKLAAMPFGLVDQIHDIKYATHSNELFVILHHLDKFGGMIFKFMYPIFGAFVAYSIADRVGLVSGFIGGVFAAGLHYTFWGVEGGIPSGFLGALILGLTAGYVSKFLNEKIKLNKNLIAMKPMLIIPAISVLTIFFLNFYIVDPVFGGLNALLSDWITAAQGAGNVVLASIIAAATAFDLGGPINKAAGAIAIGLAADQIYPLTARVLAIVIPPIGLGLATVIDKYVVGRRVFDANLRVAGNTSLLLGFIAISEGAIPFMLRNPLITIPINIIGAILGSVTAVLLGAVQWYPLPAVWGWPLVDNLWAYLIGLVVGAGFIAFANIFIRFAILKKNER